MLWWELIKSFFPSVLVTVVILSAVVPTLLAQSFFRPMTGGAADVSAVEAQEGRDVPIPHPQPSSAAPEGPSAA